MPSNIIKGSADHAPCTQIRQASAVNSGTSVNGSRRRALNKSTIKPEARELTQWVIARAIKQVARSEEHTSELQSRGHLVCRLLLEKKKARNQGSTTVDASV